MKSFRDNFYEQAKKCEDLQMTPTKGKMKPSDYFKIGQIWINSCGYKVEILDFGFREVWLYYRENNNKTSWDFEKFLAEYHLEQSTNQEELK